jgi:hypothetical protein
VFGQKRLKASAGLEGGRRKRERERAYLDELDDVISLSNLKGNRSRDPTTN